MLWPGKACYSMRCSKRGPGILDCEKCDRFGKVNCKTCDGHGRICTYLNLKISWKTERTNSVLSSGLVSKDVIRYSHGTVIVDEQGPRVTPLNIAIHKEINRTSEELIMKSNTSEKTGKIIAQRQLVKAVPMTQVDFTSNRRPVTFYICGTYHEVWVPCYPKYKLYFLTLLFYVTRIPILVFRFFKEKIGKVCQFFKNKINKFRQRD